jgi:CelD/BcsL family acetyltransferase involved in cellulose biosynthesis
MEKIARRSSKRQLGFGFFDTSQTRDELLVKAKRGWLRIYILDIDEKPVSFWQGTLRDGCLQADHTGFDSSWSTFSPGITLFLKILETIRHEDVKTVDFGCGNGQFYHCFGDIRFSEACVQMSAARLGALHLHLLEASANYATSLIRRTPYLNWARRAVWKWAQARATLPEPEDQRRRFNKLQRNA